MIQPSCFFMRLNSDNSFLSSSDRTTNGFGELAQDSDYSASTHSHPLITAYDKSKDDTIRASSPALDARAAHTLWTQHLTWLERRIQMCWCYEQTGWQWGVAEEKKSMSRETENKSVYRSHKAEGQARVSRSTLTDMDLIMYASISLSVKIPSSAFGLLLKGPEAFRWPWSFMNCRSRSKTWEAFPYVPDPRDAAIVSDPAFSYLVLPHLAVSPGRATVDIIPSC
jgi:hypothetical protein